MLIDSSYFAAGPRQILNATLGKGTTREDAVLGQFIATWQEDFLCKVLGIALGVAVSDYLFGLDEDPEAAENAAYESVCAKLRKAFADYVFFHVLGESGQTATVTGTVRLKCANQYVEPIVKQVAAWNRMADRLNLFAEWVDSGECPLEGIAIDETMLGKINRFNL